MADIQPIASDLNSKEFKEVYYIIRSILEGLATPERWSSNLIIEAADQAVTDFEDEERLIEQAKERSAGRSWGG